MSRAAFSRQKGTGALVVATGFRHYEPFIGEYGYGRRPEVVTLPDFIRLLDRSDGGEFLVHNGRPVRSAALIHCVGSRRIPGVNDAPEGRRQNEYCSRVCCTASLQAAIEFKKKFPDTVLYELYRDIRAYGRGHEDYYLEAGRNQVIFARFTPEAPPVVDSADDEESALKIIVSDTLLGGEQLDIPVDLVVLAVGMEADHASSLVEMFKLPVGADHFLLEVHPKLRPVEVAVTGVFLAGTSQAPMDITESTSAASAASAILTRGYVELDPFTAEIDPERCTGCGDCIGACLREGALYRVEGRDPRLAEVNPALCQGCGVCVAACPENAIELAGWTLGQYEAMVDAIVNDPSSDAAGGLS
ncbi:MAG: 4Fe-4S binding protein [Proteobacteria bacterium]|nr:4Fe-4S binding protein [Pseudomonadota bacterium]